MMDYSILRGLKHLYYKCNFFIINDIKVIYIMLEFMSEKYSRPLIHSLSKKNAIFVS